MARAVRLRWDQAMDKDGNDKETMGNGTGHHDKDHHDCHTLPTYPKSVTSSGAHGPDDFPIPDSETTKTHNAPVFQGGIPLSKNALASESNDIRHTSAEKYQRISSPVPMMRPEYDVVVVGSGYGGAVAASRMSRAGKSVCLLELGKERWPGEYPTDFTSAAPEIHVTGAFQKGSKVADFDGGDEQGLYHLIVGEGQNAFVANGLGGTSLLNANVFIEADHRTLSQNVFPPEIRANPGDLDEYYALARQVLQPQQYPEDFPKLAKLQLLEEQAKLLGPEFEKRFSRVHQTTTFEDRVNNMGVLQKKSTLSGQDCTGVNDGSKNSTLMNYLPDAWNHGAEIFCGCEVRYVKPCTSGPNKWTVQFAWHGDKRGKFKDSLHTELMWVQAREFLFLGAGTLGTTEILLRSRAYGLKMSPKLGMNMSGNGDILAFGYNSKMIANAIGTQNESYLTTSPVGPTINGIIDMRDEEVAPNVLDGYVIEEGAVPEALAPLLETIFRLTPGKIGPGRVKLVEEVTELAAKVSEKAFGPWHHGGSLNRTMIYLIMSHDDNQATLTLENNKPYLQFLGVERSDHVQKLNAVLTKASKAIGAEFIPNPFSSEILGQSEITVHPVGGANMSSDGTGLNGVTNHFGQVFKGTGVDVYDGLVVVDGAVVPAALGCNPFATITAFAERSVRGVAKANGIEIDYASRNGRINWKAPKKSWPMTEDIIQAQKEIAKSPQTGGARFTEIMDGYLYVGDDIEDFEIARDAAKGASSSARFYLSVDAWDINTLINKDNHAAMLTGTFSCGALSKDPFMVLRGDFQLFSRDPRTPDTDNLVYNFDMLSTSGEIVHFYGYKVVDPSIAFSLSETWTATTTLYIELSRPDKSIIGRGILTISLRNFVDELLSFRGDGQTDWQKKVATDFFMPLDASEYPHPPVTAFVQRHPPTSVVTVTASDGVVSPMQMWVPAHATRSMPILLVPGASVDYQIFGLPTIPYNFLDYLLERGYTVYCITHRVGKVPVAKSLNATGFDARLDIAAATKYILQDSKVSKIYAVVHCVGAIAMASGLLDGTIEGIGGLTVSQVFIHPVFAEGNMWKAKFKPSLAEVYEKVLGKWFEVVDGNKEVFEDLLLQFYPEGEKAEVCRSTVCHRADLIFGRLWVHANLNDATHQNLASFLGGISMNTLQKLMFMGSHGFVADNNEMSLVTPKNLERLRDIPILFIHGGENAVYSPVSTEKDYDFFREMFGEENYERVVFHERGHLDCWMGKTCFRDVYPAVETHARKTILARNLM